VAAPVDLLKEVPLFNGIDGKQLKRIADAFVERTFSIEQELTTQGESGVGFFVIGQGEVRVTVDGEERAVLGHGDYFGEIALLDTGRRTATITAMSDGTMYGLTSWQFRPLVDENPSIAWPLLEEMARRQRDPQS
jgi:CRP/FNR family transcriptional regulator, cyclic AMP receptor protein